MDFGAFVGFVLLLLCFVAPCHHCIGVVIVQRECAEGCCRIKCKLCLAVHSGSLLSECMCDGVLRERRCEFAVAKGALLLLCCVSKCTNLCTTTFICFLRCKFWDKDNQVPFRDA